MSILQKPFELFLSRSLGQKEPALIIAQSSAELKEFQVILKQADFKLVKNISNLMKKTKSANKQYFLIEQSNNFKDVYDFMAQYASGQVQIYNQKTLKADVFNPDYVNSCILFLITKENILNLKSQGYDLISLAGITYQI